MKDEEHFRKLDYKNASRSVLHANDIVIRVAKVTALASERNEYFKTRVTEIWARCDQIAAKIAALKTDKAEPIDPALSV